MPPFLQRPQSFLAIDVMSIVTSYDIRKRCIPGEIKPALGVLYRLTALHLSPLVKELLLLLSGDFVFGAFLAGHGAQDQDAGDEEQDVHGDQVTRGAQPLMRSAARFRIFIQKCGGPQMCGKNLFISNVTVQIGVFC